jgi:hypothetical protein
MRIFYGYFPRSTPLLSGKAMPPLPPQILALQKKSHLFQSPAFYKSKLSDIHNAAATVTRAHVHVIGHSHGNRPIHAFEYGVFEPQSPRTTISSALSSDRPSSFFDPAKRTRPALTLIACMHGGETEGIAVCLNLIHIMETGKDLAGNDQAPTRDLLSRLRLTLIPCMNPDGRARALVDHLVGAELDDLYLVQQGVWADGSLPKGRAIKEIQPFPADKVQYLGGYYNDAGINLQHDDFFGPKLAPENRATIDYLAKELPDAILSLHGHGTHPCFFQPDAMVSPAVFRRQEQATSYALARLTAAGFDALHPDQCSPPPWCFTFQTFVHQATGALPLLFELPQGIQLCPYTHDRILASGTIAAASIADFALRFGLRPAYGDPYPRVTPA